MRRFDHVDGDGFNNRFANLRYATRSQKSRQPAPQSKARAATAPAMAPASRSGSAPTPTPARTRCRRAEGATKRRHWAECFGGGMIGRSCAGSQDHPTLTSHEGAAAHSITSSARVLRVTTSAARVGRTVRPCAQGVGWGWEAGFDEAGRRQTGTRQHGKN